MEVENEANVKSEPINNVSSENELSSDKEFDVNLNFDEELSEKPVILTYIKRLQKYVQKQEKKIKKLRSKLKHHKSKHKNRHCIDSCTQTYTENPAKTLAEEITEAAENAVLQSGFVYESTSGMYYDYNSGYYYNAELGLYYDGNTGHYLVYNEETKTYDFHSQAVVDTEFFKGKRKKSPENKVKKFNGVDGLETKRPKHSEDDKLPLEDGECSSSNDESSLSDCSETSDVAESWPPCMRIILKETTVTRLKIGALFIVTCDGGTLGREGDHSILIPDINVSKHHATITFDKESSRYKIVDLGSRNGTLLNGKRLSASKQESEPQEIIHGSVLQIGNTKLLCHIHKGQQTCGHCEPGLVQTEEACVVEEKPSKKKLSHKEELKRLRKKFGIENNYSDNPRYFPTGYSDRAQHRRKFIGSYNENEKTHQASVDEPVAANNKGFKMLSKMGWKQGKSLGKDGTGVKEPIPLVGNVGTCGLGSNAVSFPAVAEDERAKRKQLAWRKTQRRYELSQSSFAEAFRSDDDEEPKEDEDEEKDKGEKES